jgi:hypothetical protein
VSDRLQFVDESREVNLATFSKNLKLSDVLHLKVQTRRDTTWRATARGVLFAFPLAKQIYDVDKTFFKGEPK